MPPLTQSLLSLVAEGRAAPRSAGPLKNAMDAAPARQMAVPTIFATLLGLLMSTFSSLRARVGVTIWAAMAEAMPRQPKTE